MNTHKSLLVLSSIYIICMLLGLSSGFEIIHAMHVEKTIKPMVPNPDSVGSSLIIFLYILFMTSIFLILIKKGMGRFMKYFIYLALFSGTFFTLDAILGPSSIFLTIIIILAFIRNHENILVQDVVITIAIAGLGAILGSSLSFKPSLVLIVLLSIYDIASVFITKHMVTIARTASKQIPLMVIIPVGNQRMGLGTGDLAIPLTFIVSVLQTYGIGHAIPTMLGGLLGIVFLFYFTLDKRGTVLPALPPITAGLFTGLGLTFMFL